MDIIIGSAVGCLPLMTELYRTGRKVELIGHSATQTAAALCNSFKEISYHDHNSYFDTLDKAIGESNESMVYPGPHDLCFRVFVQYMASRGLLPSKDVELAEALHNKRFFRDRIQSISSAHTPKTYLHEDLVDLKDLDFPVLFKPDHAGGGRGIVKLASNAELNDFRSSLSQDKSSGVYEEFLEGELYSVSLWQQNGKVLSFYGEKEFIDKDKFKVNASITSNAIQKHLKSLNIPETLAEILLEFGLDCGFSHTQILLKTNGDWKIVECTLRLPGDLYPLNAQNFGGLPYCQMYLHSFLDKKLEFFKFPKMATFPDDLTYGRVMHDTDAALSKNVRPFINYNSHNKKVSGSYQISYFKLPEMNSLDVPVNLFD
ncbi:ATP-grasp domain-containing protein [Gammaproteobacteria bacterium]|nr:ATP-grasp domain-containing protein [Gammaproteobacteria bacterium]